MKAVARAAIEVGFIVFLFYANLFMGEFSRTGGGKTRGLLWAVEDVFTGENFAIALVAAVAGYFVVELLRKRFL